MKEEVVMQRTQVYLTLEERAALTALAKQSGKTQSQLLREAVDEFLEKRHTINRAAILQKAKGMWAKRAASLLLSRKSRNP